MFLFLDWIGLVTVAGLIFSVIASHKDEDWGIFFPLVPRNAVPLILGRMRILLHEVMVCNTKYGL